jgi:hypothetical protein
MHFLHTHHTVLNWPVTFSDLPHGSLVRTFQHHGKEISSFWITPPATDGGIRLSWETALQQLEGALANANAIRIGCIYT